MCRLCSTSMIDSNQKKISSTLSIIKLLNDKGINIIEDGINISLVDKNTLKDAIIHLPSHNKETVKAITILNNNKYEIKILWGLNQIEFESALAHELLHVWIDYNNIRLNEAKLSLDFELKPLSINCFADKYSISYNLINSLFLIKRLSLFFSLIIISFCKFSRFFLKLLYISSLSSIIQI